MRNQNTLLGFKLHWRTPALPGHLRFQTGAYRFNGKWTENFNHHPVKTLFGISFKTWWLFGFIAFEEYRHQSEEKQEPRQ
ncbi:hypothetical protein BTE77_27860 [Ensifer adhaerens]|nr:hypothetical protein BTE77_27860 [Ensifer adhaerens]